MKKQNVVALSLALTFATSSGSAQISPGGSYALEQAVIAGGGISASSTASEKACRI